MAFKAAKKRERKPPEPVAKGSALIPSAAIRLWYQGKLKDITAAMLADYREQLRRVLKDSDVQQFFAQDATASSLLEALMARMFKKWSDVFDVYADETAEEFCRKSDDYVNVTTFNSLSTAGVNQPTLAYNSNVQETLQASLSFNHTLITGISSDVHDKIYTAVMLSLTSPDPERQGMSGIENALREVGGFAENRIKLISRDQTSKLYSSLSDERMAQNGIEEFEWLHSSAGKEPRQTHVDKDGMIFKLNDPRLWEGPKADRGPPGWAINCRCRKRPVIL